MATVTNYLDRFLDPMTETFTPQMAETIVGLRADEELAKHIETLRQKANAGTLSPQEDADYKEFVEAVDVISIIQAKARQFLARNSA